MLANQNIDTLKSALIAKLGFDVTDAMSSEQLSIDIFIKTKNYISKTTIMRLFGLLDDHEVINAKVMSFLAEYAALTDPSENIE